jgi:FAD/FMN-containing dehydrogenase
MSITEERGRMTDLLVALRAALGDSGVLTGSADTASYCTDWRGLYHGATLAVLRPAGTEQLAAAVRICAAAGVAMVPQGGNTSMVGGATPSEDGRQVVVSMARMHRVRDLDPLDMTLTIEAGATLHAARAAAAAAGCELPLSISAEGSAQIGGVLATNAGGNLTVRHGNARDLVLGMEAVFADGQIWRGLRRLRKDNTGYALRQLLVGSEGTLGFITAAVLRLVPAAAEVAVALCAVPDAAAALRLFARVRRANPGALAAFEYMSGASMDLVLTHVPGATLPLAQPAPGYVLLELSSPAEEAGLRAVLEAVLEAAFEAGEASDAVLAESEAQRAALWRLREEHSEGQRLAGATVKNDVSVPVSRVADFLARADAACAALVPGIRPVPFGHVGDGNIHYNLLAPAGADPAGFLARGEAIMHAVGEVVRALDGSFSAEHGIGRLKAHMLPEWRGGAELEMMRRIKAVFDPRGLLNPGKLLPPADRETASMNRADFEAGLRADGFPELAETTMPPDTARPTHAHPFEVRALMLEGALHLACDGSERRYGPGEVFSMAAGREHVERTGPEGARYLVGRKPV